VTAKAPAIKLAQITGDIPQNINFAINATLAETFLNAHGVLFHIAEDASVLPSAEIAKAAQGYSPLVECWE
jgi:hypothetical protein